MLRPSAERVARLGGLHRLLRWAKAILTDLGGFQVMSVSNIAQGTAGTVKALTVDQVAATGADIILGNTYHLMLRPSAERVARMGGLHRFMRWAKPILTDSGGFQVMSLSKIAKVTEDAVTFASHI